MGSIPFWSRNWECGSQSWSFLLNSEPGGTRRFPSEMPSDVHGPYLHLEGPYFPKVSPGAGSGLFGFLLRDRVASPLESA